jgi:hypothetical protein
MSHIRYRESAQSAAELNIGDLIPMHEAIPEFARFGQMEKRAAE